MSVSATFPVLNEFRTWLYSGDLAILSSLAEEINCGELDPSRQVINPSQSYLRKYGYSLQDHVVFRFALNR